MNRILFIGAALAAFHLQAMATPEIIAVKAHQTHPLKLQPSPQQAVLQLLQTSEQDPHLPNLLNDQKWEKDKDGKLVPLAEKQAGFSFVADAGPDHRSVIGINRTADSPDRSISQQVTLNQNQPQTFLISGQSKAENVSGNKDGDYSLYIDVIYQDGTPEWGITRSFAVGTHDWQQLRFTFTPKKPVKSLTFYALYRGSHTGQVWFRDLALKQIPVDPRGIRFDGEAAKSNFPQTLQTNGPIRKISTGDGLSLQLNDSGAAQSVTLQGKTQQNLQALSGFMARDVANETGYYPLTGNKFSALQLGLQQDIKSTFNAITISGQLQDQSKHDRAVSLVYAVPLDAVGWQWGDDIRHSRTIREGQEYSNLISINVGANGEISQYPLAALWYGKQGIAICLDMNQAAQFRVAYNAALKCLYIVYDIGMTTEKPRADFKFVIYGFDGNWGYRAATAKMYTLFPKLFEVRGEAKKQGIWMPFAKVEDVQGWQDFGFRFREADYDKKLAWDDAHGILTFRYTEPSTFWMPMPEDKPRDYQNAVNELQGYLGKDDAKGQGAEAVLNSGMRRADGTLAVRFINAPWMKAAVWNVNTLPGLSGNETGAKLAWNAERRAQYASDKPFGELDGEYLDSTEGYVTDDLDFDRTHFAASTTPLTFDTDTHQPGLYKTLMVYELVRRMHQDLKAMGKYSFANSTPARICFLTPWFDAMGTETNWNFHNNFAPPTDQEMNKWRTLAGQKAYCLLQNTNMEAFAPYTEKYFQQSLFYGMFPSFFSADAATHPYWQNPVWYNRDRPLFQKYIPLIQHLSAAGWQPVTLARSSNPQIRLERFGSVPGDQYVQENAPHLYLTVFNPADEAQQTTLKADGIKFPETVSELINGKVLSSKGGTLDLTLGAGQVMLLQLH